MLNYQRVHGFTTSITGSPFQWVTIETLREMLEFGRNVQEEVG